MATSASRPCRSFPVELSDPRSGLTEAQLADWLAPFRSFGTTFQFLISDIPGKQLADLMDVRETAISAIETGRNTIPPERYEQLAKLLNVPAQKFTVHILRYDNPWLFKMIFLARQAAARRAPG